MSDEEKKPKKENVSFFFKTIAVAVALALLLPLVELWSKGGAPERVAIYALAVSILGFLVVIYQLRQQTKISHLESKVSLFDKRFRIYREIVALETLTGSSLYENPGTIRAEDYNSLIATASEAELLFCSPEIKEVILALVEATRDLNEYIDENYDRGNTDLLVRKNNALQEEYRRVHENALLLIKRSPFLNLH